MNKSASPYQNGDRQYGVHTQNLLSPGNVADGTLAGSLHREADEIFNKLDAVQERGLSAAEIDGWYGHEWERLHERRPELFEVRVWDEIFLKQ